MKLLISALALSVLVTAPAAFAAKKSQDKPWYVQATFGAVIKTNAAEQAIIDLNKQGHKVESLSFENSNSSYQLQLGYQFSEHWAATAGYVDFGATEFNVHIETPYADLLVKDIAAAAPRYGNGNTFGLVYSYKVLPQLMLAVDGGALFLESQYNAKVNVGTDQEPVYYQQKTKDSSVQWYAGAGVSYLYDNFEAGIYFRHYDIDQVNSQWLGLRLGYHF